MKNHEKAGMWFGFTIICCIVGEVGYGNHKGDPWLGAFLGGVIPFMITVWFTILHMVGQVARAIKGE